MPITSAELAKAFAGLSEEERAAIMRHAPPARQTQAPHKWQALADAIPDDRVEVVVNACRDGLEHAAKHASDDDADGAGWQRLADVAPTLANAVRASSLRRGKSLVWGLGRVSTYLQSEEAANRRAAARRRVPRNPPATSAAAAGETAGKGGAK